MISLDTFLSLCLLASCIIGVRGADDRFRAQFKAPERKPGEPT